LQDKFAQCTREEWESTFNDEIPFAPVKRFEDVFDLLPGRGREMLEYVEIGKED